MTLGYIHLSMYCVTFFFGALMLIIICLLLRRRRLAKKKKRRARVPRSTLHDDDPEIKPAVSISLGDFPGISVAYHCEPIVVERSLRKDERRKEYAKSVCCLKTGPTFSRNVGNNNRSQFLEKPCPGLHSTTGTPKLSKVCGKRYNQNPSGYATVAGKPLQEQESSFGQISAHDSENSLYGRL